MTHHQYTTAQIAHAYKIIGSVRGTCEALGIGRPRCKGALNQEKVMTKRIDATPEQLLQIRHLVEVEKLRIKDVADRLNIPYGRAYRYICENGIIPAGQRAKTEISDDLIIETYIETKSMSRTARKLRSSENRVLEAFQRKEWVKTGRVYAPKVKKSTLPPDEYYRPLSAPKRAVPSVVTPRPLDKSSVEYRMNKMPSTRCYA